MCKKINMTYHVASVTHAAEKLFDKIPEFMNPIVYNNSEACNISIHIGYNTMCVPICVINSIRLLLCGNRDTRVAFAVNGKIRM